MNVLYDISWIGVSLARKQPRTGLIRAIECTADALLRRTDCNVGLTAALSREAYHGAQTFFDTGSILPRNRFISPPAVTRTASRLADALNRIGDKWTPRRGTGLLRRAALKFAQWGKVEHQLVDLRRLNEAQIFQAQYSGMPPWVRKFPHLTLFHTVYDIIPLVLPGAVSEGHVKFFSEIIQGIHPDDHVICISHSAKADLCAYRPDLSSARVHVAHLGASSAFRPCTRDEAIPEVRKKYLIPDGPYLLAIGTLVPHKNFARLVESFVTVCEREKIHDLSLVISGSAGWDMHRFTSVLEQHHLDRNRIVLTGYTADADLPALYGGALAFVFPSLYEGFGLPVLEAMQCGTPVLCSNSSSIPEVGGDAALYFDPKNGEEISAAILEVYQNPTLRAELAGKSLVQAKKFSWDQCAEDTVAAYEVALRSKHG